MGEHDGVHCNTLSRGFHHRECPEDCLDGVGSSLDCCSGNIAELAPPAPSLVRGGGPKEGASEHNRLSADGLLSASLIL